MFEAEDYAEIREAVRKLCERFPDACFSVGELPEFVLPEMTKGSEEEFFGHIYERTVLLERMHTQREEIRDAAARYADREPLGLQTSSNTPSTPKNPGVARALPDSWAIAHAPCSQKSTDLLSGESGYAQPGQSTPCGWFSRGSVASAWAPGLPISALAVPCSEPKPPAGFS